MNTLNTQIDIPIDPDFSFIKSTNAELQYKSAYDVITKMNKWEFLRNYKCDPNTGFMFDDNPEINEIMNQINIAYDDLHSGGSLGYLMRNMQSIAILGFDKYKALVEQQQY